MVPKSPPSSILELLGLDFKASGLDFGASGAGFQGYFGTTGRKKEVHMYFLSDASNLAICFWLVAFSCWLFAFLFFACCVLSVCNVLPKSQPSLKKYKCIKHCFLLQTSSHMPKEGRRYVRSTRNLTAKRSRRCGKSFLLMANKLRIIRRSVRGGR